MLFFGKRKRAKYEKQIFGENIEYKKQKRKRLWLTLAAFFIVFLIVIVNATYYLSTVDFDSYSRNMENLTMKKMNADDLNLVWSKNGANVDIMKNKLDYVGLSTPAHEINAMTIKSSTNHPSKNLRLNFNEVAYFANTVISYNSNFELIDFVWETNGNIVTLTTHYSYNSYEIIDTQSSFFFEEVFDYNLAEKTIDAKQAKLLNIGQNGKTIADLTQLTKIRIALTQFILLPSFEEITDITKKPDDSTAENKDMEFQSRPLCQMLGFSNLNITSSGMEYIV